MELELEELFGLPAHPLIVHLPIVLIPLAALGTLAIVISPKWRHRLDWLVVAAVAISLVFVQLATGSGEALEEGVEDTASRVGRHLIDEHAEMGEQLLPVVALFFVALLAFVLLARAADRRAAVTDGADTPAKRQPLMIVLGVVTVLFAALSVVQVVRVGHSGADATWHEVDPSEEGNSGPG